MDKQHIIDEIRRTAIDGKPLGRDRFEIETGIKEYDWLGKYWTKWSEAQIEAGYEALTFNAAFDDDHILQAILLLTRKLGVIPTVPHMRMERRVNQSFPNDSVIRRRWNNQALILELCRYCDEHTEFVDLKQLFYSKLKISAPKTKDSDSKPSQLRNIGYVYLIRAQGAFKIGWTRALYRRAAEIANQSAKGAELIHSISTDDPEGIEKYWHGRFASKRLEGINKQSGEWFSLSSEDVRAFKRRKCM